MRTVHQPVTTRSEAPRRRAAALAGHLGDTDTLRELLDDPHPAVRATVLTALQRCDALYDDVLRAALADTDPQVRHRAAELAASHDGVSLIATLSDRDPLVVEAAAWAAGERPDDPERTAVLLRLVELAAGHRDPLVREAAVAAIGSLAGATTGDDRPEEHPEERGPEDCNTGDDDADLDPMAAGRRAVLAAMGDKPNIRRRAVLALVAFDGPEVDAALRAATADRDWQVREAAEELLRIGDADLARPQE